MHYFCDVYGSGAFVAQTHSLMTGPAGSAGSLQTTSEGSFLHTIWVVHGPFLTQRCWTSGNADLGPSEKIPSMFTQTTGSGLSVFSGFSGFSSFTTLSAWRVHAPTYVLPLNNVTASIMTVSLWRGYSGRTLFRAAYNCILTKIFRRIFYNI